MMYVQSIHADGSLSTTITRDFKEANAAYWQAVSFGEPGTEVQAHGFIPKRSSTFKCFSFGTKERMMNQKHEAVVPKNERLVRA
jgi:hypothetical protein